MCHLVVTLSWSVPFLALLSGKFIINGILWSANLCAQLWRGSQRNYEGNLLLQKIALKNFSKQIFSGGKILRCHNFWQIFHGKNFQLQKKWTATFLDGKNFDQQNFQMAKFFDQCCCLILILFSVDFYRYQIEQIMNEVMSSCVLAILSKLF